MTRDELLNKYETGERDFSGANLRSADLREANLYGANLREANLRSANLRGADLRSANLRGADLSGADLQDANLSGANLRSADLSGANLYGANLREANLRSANLQGADLQDANLSGADLSGADLSGANLREANLRSANLYGADLSGATGLLDPAKWLQENFIADEHGLIVYKAIGYTAYSAPSHWVIGAGSILTEVCNPCRTVNCACGVNFGTFDWCRKQYPSSAIWRCRIPWLDLASVVVPYHTVGKARGERVQLLEQVYIPQEGE